MKNHAFFYCKGNLVYKIKIRSEWKWNYYTRYVLRIFHFHDHEKKKYIDR